MKRFFLIPALVLACHCKPVFACTNYLITKGASKDGSSMITYSADSHVLYGELYHWPARIWAPGSMLDIYEWDTGEYKGKIAQVAETCNVVGNINNISLP